LSNGGAGVKPGRKCRTGEQLSNGGAGVKPGGKSRTGEQLSNNRAGFEPVGQVPPDNGSGRGLGSAAGGGASEATSRQPAGAGREAPGDAAQSDGGRGGRSADEDGAAGVGALPEADVERDLAEQRNLGAD